ncbi:M16 family metallopeptidase [Pasteurella bettyae]|uniref:M16 family metallopeptidase n=1 Tax=Pasteurella bettyae TaxID=752 RepID=UPI003D2C9F4A
MPTFFVMMKTLIFLFQILLLMACQGAIPTTTTTSTLLPFNPNIHHGVLANGLNYYILSNKEPENRVYMRLVVNAGSMNEDDDQKGVAHIVEHMAFNGSQKYPKKQIINALEQLGMKFARDINAFTDFENTVYTLNIAKNDDETLLLALDVINEWMNHLTILPEDLDSERGVVLEEWRARLSPMLRLGDKKSAVEMQGSRYVLRDPIGDVAVIKGVTTQRVRDFYQKWYRPDNMALIVVGDINKSSLENLIAQKLSNSTHDTQAPLPKIDYGIPLIKQWRVASVSEPEMTTSSLELSFFSDAVNKETEADYRKDLLQQIVQRLINLRLQQWENQQSAVINSANFYHSYLGKQTLQTIFSLQLNSPKYDKALDVLFHFISELKQQGFSQAELKAELERLTQRNEKESQIQVGSLKLANDLIPIIANGQVSLSAKDRYQLNRRLLKSINLAEIDRTFEEMIASQARLVLVTQPSSAKSLPFSADTVAQRWQQAMNDRSHHWKDEAIPAAMPELHFKAGTLMREKYWDKGNITEYCGVVTIFA